MGNEQLRPDESDEKNGHDGETIRFPVENVFTPGSDNFSDGETPFNVIVDHPTIPISKGADEDDPEESDNGKLLDDDLEAAYQQALASVEAAEVEMQRSFQELQADEPVVSNTAEGRNESTEESEPTSATDRLAEAIEEDLTPDATQERVTPRQIIEAVLFVGGDAITTRKLCNLFHIEMDTDAVEAIIDDMNTQYRSEQRPYEIVFGEGGYRIQLLYPFERVRARVYGQAPKEVKLSQDALEVLSLIAYHQPIAKGDLLAAKSKADGPLRQLIRRELVQLERSEAEPKVISYRTTPRFLQVFGLVDLDELPRAEELEFK